MDSKETRYAYTSVCLPLNMCIEADVNNERAPEKKELADLVEFCSGAERVISVDAHQARNLITQDPPYRYLDVRTEEEFNKGHPEKAFNIPYMFNTPQGRVKNPKFMDQVLADFGKEDHLVVGCQSGVRSVHATSDLLDADFEHVYNMSGGYNAWVENGFPIQKTNHVEINASLP